MKINPDDRKDLDRMIEVQRYESLQRSADEQMKRVTGTYEKHASQFIGLVKTAAWIGSIFVIMVTGAAGYFFYHSLHDAEASVTDLVRAHFDEPRVRTTISEGIRNEIALVTTNEIQTIAQNQMNPRLNEFVIMFQAMTYQSDAFSNIVKLSGSVTNEEDRRALLGIKNTLLVGVKNAVLQAKWTSQYGNFPWSNYNFNPETNDIEAYSSLLGRFGQEFDCVLFETLSQNRKIPSKTKNELYAELLKPGDLRPIGTICAIIAQEANHPEWTVVNQQDCFNWLKTNSTAVGR